MIALPGTSMPAELHGTHVSGIPRHVGCLWVTWEANHVWCMYYSAVALKLGYFDPVTWKFKELLRFCCDVCQGSLRNKKLSLKRCLEDSYVKAQRTVQEWKPWLRAVVTSWKERMECNPRGPQQYPESFCSSVWWGVNGCRASFLFAWLTF